MAIPRRCIRDSEIAFAPEGPTYVSSWVDTTFERCYQLMEADDRQLLDEWIARWSDIADFEASGHHIGSGC